MLKGFQLRPDQIEVVAAFCEALTNHKRIVVSCPTGAGKTVIAALGIIPMLPHPVLWVTHRTELAKQAELATDGVEVRMIQSGVSGSFASIIIDEGHHVCSSQYSELIGNYPDATIVALTATPYRLDGVGLGTIGFSKIVHGWDIFQMTEAGLLCRSRCFIPRSENRSAWTPFAAAKEMSLRSFRKAIVFCRSVVEAKQTAKELSQRGIRAVSIDGQTSVQARASALAKFKRGKIDVLCNHTIFTEGTDLPSVDLIVLNRHTHSRCLWKQMIGRGLRTHPGKTLCTVLDLASNGAVHGSIYDKEIFDLQGEVASTESRELSSPSGEQEAQKYEHNEGEELKPWTPAHKPVRIIESLQKLKSKSPLHRLRIGFSGA